MRRRICLRRTRLTRFLSSSLRNRSELKSTVSTFRLLMRWMTSGMSAASAANRNPAFRKVRFKDGLHRARARGAAGDARPRMPRARYPSLFLFSRYEKSARSYGVDVRTGT